MTKDVLFSLTKGAFAPQEEMLEVARKKGIKIIGLTGKDGGKMAGICDVEIRAPRSEYADRAQEIHIKVIHSLIDYVEVTLSAF